MTHGSLFSGIGGFDLAAEWMGWTNVFHCEFNPFGQRVLKHYWPDSISYGDIKQTDFTIHRGGIDVLSGGFPCQPFSSAGKRKGTEDDRHLWPQMLRAIREIQPAYVVGENVRGFTNWNGGMVFDQAQADLEAEGYEVLPFLLPACAVNAPHRRDRIWFVGHRTNENHSKGIRSEPSIKNTYQDGRGGIKRKEEPKERRLGNIGTGNNERLRADIEDAGTTANALHDGRSGGDEVNADKRGVNALNDLSQNEGEGTTPDTSQIGSQSKRQSTGMGWVGLCFNGSRFDKSTWQDFQTQPPVCGRTHGISSFLARNIKQEVYATISERYTDKDLQEVREAIQSEKVLREIGGLYKIHEPGILLEVLQLCSPSITEPQGVSVWSEKASEGLMRKVREYGTFANTPQGRELEKQFRKQFADSLPILSHEIALVAMEAERAAQKFASWHRKESIMAYGNAIVPQVAFELFKVIDKMKQLWPGKKNQSTNCTGASAKPH